MNAGRLVILSGPSGSGKDTVIAAWSKRNPRVKRVVAYTTRPPRPGEVEGDDYHFVDQEAFRMMADAGEFLEWKQVHGQYYATPLRDMQRMLEGGLVAVLKIDVQGALSAMEKQTDALSIFLEPPSLAELERRLRARGTDSEEQMKKRLKNAEWELSQAHLYNRRVVNDDVERAADEIERILQGAV